MNLPLIPLVRTIDTYNAPIQIAAMLSFFQLFGLLYLVEQMVLYPMLLALVVVVGYVVCTKPKKSKMKIA